MLLVIYFLFLIIVYTSFFSDVIEKHVGNLFSDDDENELHFSDFETVSSFLML